MNIESGIYTFEKVKKILEQIQLEINSMEQPIFVHYKKEHSTPHERDMDEQGYYTEHLHLAALVGNDFEENDEFSISKEKGLVKIQARTKRLLSTYQVDIKLYFSEAKIPPPPVTQYFYAIEKEDKQYLQTDEFSNKVPLSVLFTTNLKQAHRYSEEAKKVVERLKVVFNINPTVRKAQEVISLT